MPHACPRVLPWRSKLWIILIFFLLPGVFPVSAAAGEPGPLQLETVFPVIPGKNQVRWWEFDWKWAEFIPVPGGAPVKLFFYEEEREVAGLAKPAIAKAYQEYVTTFAYRPQNAIPFLLYNSHAEFESTTAFLISENVLGVTSTGDLTMALPYWGEHQRFEHVMRHELAHQFTIQKVSSLKHCNAVQSLPLWFIEGIAEFYALPKLTAEVRASLADAHIHRKDSKSKNKKRLPGFFDEQPMTFERVYLMGHAQVRFLEETYGAGTVRKLLEASNQLCNRSFFSGPASNDFEELVGNTLGVKSAALQQAWRAWVRQETAPAHEARQNFESLELLKDIPEGLLDAFTLSSDGTLILYRVLDYESGITRIYLRDVSDPGSEIVVAADRQLGLETLHPLDRRVMAIGRDRIVYIGRRGASDRIFVRKFTREAEGGRVRLRIGKKTVHDVAHFDGMIEAGSPAFDPHTGALAFTGLSRKTGVLDIFRMETPLEDGAKVTRVTNDAYAETGLVFEPDGSMLTASDATPDGRYDIVRIQRDGTRTAVTRIPGIANATAPSPDGRGGFLFASDLNGWSQIYHSQETATTRLTEVPTAIYNPALDSEGNLLGISVVDQARRLVRIPRERWVNTPVPLPEALGLPTPPGRSLVPESLGKVRPYDRFSPRNFRLAGVLVGGATGSFLIGDVVFTDLFKSQLAGVSFQVLEGLDQSSLELYYIDRAGRWGKGGSLFVQTGIQLEPDFPARQNTFLLRRFGASLMAEYPFGRFMRVEGSVSPQGIQAYRFEQSDSPFARENAGTFPAVNVGVGFALDNLRLSRFGPIGGTSLMLNADGTWAFGKADPFAKTTLDLQRYYSLIRGYERLYLAGRLAGGTSRGGAFREQFFLPAAYNLRAVPDGVLDLLGEHYYVGKAELHFPIGKAGRVFYLEGIAGADAGAIVFKRADAWSERVAAAVTGINVGLTPIVIGLHVARPFSIGGADPDRRLLWHLSLALLPMEP